MANLNDGRVSVNVTGNKTLTAADAGIVQNVTADGVVITLPATANGLVYKIRNGGAAPTNAAAGAVANQSVGLNITPQAADGVTGLGFTAAVSKGALQTKSSANVGDEIVLEANGTTGATGWTITGAVGTWTRQA
jgi:hypothetical protein